MIINYLLHRPYENSYTYHFSYGQVSYKRFCKDAMRTKFHSGRIQKLTNIIFSL